MKTLLKKLPFLVAVLTVAGVFNSLRAATAFVYDTGTELLTSSDFNNDGTLDVLVVDKSTGNLRVGFLNAGGTLFWSAPLASGVENVTGCAVGHFLQSGQNSVAVTAPDFNRINLVSLANTNSAGTPVTLTPTGLGPHTLVALDNPDGTAVGPTNLLAASLANAGDTELLERWQVAGGMSALPAFPAQFNESGQFDRGNALTLAAGSLPGFAIGLVRGTSADRFDLLQFTNQPGGLLASFTNLPPGGDYALGNFNGETLPRFVWYQPGTSNVLFAPLLNGTNGLQFDVPLIWPFTEAVQRVFYLSASTGSFLVEFADGVQEIHFSGSTPVAGAIYRSGLASTNNVFTGLIPLANGKFVLLDAAGGAMASTHAQVVSLSGSSFSKISSSYLPATTIRTVRANVWFFQSEPFVNRNPGLVASLSSPDWSDQILGLPAALSVIKESDSGSGTGLGSLATNSPGAPPTGANYALANQVAEGISIFSYAPPRAAEPVTITINPAPGIYSHAVQVSFTTLAAGDTVHYQAGTSDNWHSYAAPFGLTNTGTVEYYGQNSGGARSRLSSANYFIADSVGPATSLNLTNGTVVTNTNATSGSSSGGSVTLSPGGTVFYGRKNTNGGTIWSINLDGSDDTYLTLGARPRVSHDGHYLAFMRGTNGANYYGGDIWVRDLTTGNEWLIYTNPSYVVGYDWDQTNPPHLILDNGCSFWSASPSNPPTVFPLANTCYWYAPVVNPVDGRIAYFNTAANTGTTGYGPASGIAVASADGATVHPLTATAVNSEWPAWSPDGSRLSFCYLNNLYANNGQADLYTINADGTALAQISAFTSSADGFVHGAIWTTDGKGLVGAGSIGGTNGLWLIPLTPDAQQCDCPARLLPTTPGDPIDFAGSAIAATPPSVAKPGLLIRADDTNLVVYWSTNYQGFSLQSTTNLTTSAWTAITGPYYLSGGYFEYREPRTALAPQKFFQLTYPGMIIIQP